MAMIKCPECQSSVSDKAASCPKCGNPFRVAAVPKRGEVKCLDCGNIGKPKRIGWDFASFLIVIVGLAAFFVPGLIYAIWRGAKSKVKCCAKCRSTRLAA